MTQEAILAGGCFWGVEELFRSLKGVTGTQVGYTGGKIQNPTYESHEGHAEALLVTYDDSVISYQQILDFFFQIHNPTTLNQQGNDRGTSYRSAIFYKNEDEKHIGEKMITVVNNSKRWPDKVVTSLEYFEQFWPAESYHQDYLQKNVGGYTCHAVYFDSYLQ